MKSGKVDGMDDKKSNPQPSRHCRRGCDDAIFERPKIQGALRVPATMVSHPPRDWVSLLFQSLAVHCDFLETQCFRVILLQ